MRAIKTSFLVILLSVGGVLPGFSNEPIRIESTSFGATVGVPVGRYSDFCNFTIGGTWGLTLSRPDGSWLVGTQIGGAWMQSIDPYASLLARFQVLAVAGYRLPLGDGGWSFIPQVSAGMVVHMASGAFNTLDNDTKAFYFDQLYGLQFELAYEPWRGGKTSRWGFYLTPGFFVFTNQGNQLGMQADLELGIRIRFGSDRDDELSTESPATPDEQ